MDSEVRPFQLDVPQETLAWIEQRVETARIIPDIQHPQGMEWEDGTPSSTVEELVNYWKNEYDWRSVEKRINSTFKMFKVDLEEAGELISLHFVHHRSEEQDAVPLLFAHGWPGNFLEVESLLPLTKRSDPKHPVFHIVCPSIPGFTLSSSPSKSRFTPQKIANMYHKLMLKLGYSHYIAQGGDWGSMIIRAMGLQHPEACVGVHINMVITLPPSPLKHPLTLLWLILRWFTPEEKKRLGRMKWWQDNETGYQAIQSTKPQTISYGLLDSPIGMLAWIREKLECLAEPGYVWSKELIITWTMLYLISNSAGHARIYKQSKEVYEGYLGRPIPREVFVGVSCFPYDVFYIPIWWARGTVADNIVLWKEQEHGGHFASVECPDQLTEDIFEFVEKIQGDRWRQLLQAGK
ncbi:hypothetical protein AX16_005197 [Volvariella volvacea WC 439]|nr:hypothetical protein AX16_005197 [Volvariella volvacea WC 439]